jgi:hypothetical protein
MPVSVTHAAMGLGYHLDQYSPRSAAVKRCTHQAGDRISKVRDDITRRGQNPRSHLYTFSTGQPSVTCTLADVVGQLCCTAPRQLAASVVVIERPRCGDCRGADWVIDLGGPDGNADAVAWWLQRRQRWSVGTHTGRPAARGVLVQV